MIEGNSIVIVILILLVMGYLVIYGSSSTNIKEGLTCPRKYKQIASNQSCNWKRSYRGASAVQKISRGSLEDLQKECDNTPECEYVDYVYRQWGDDPWAYGDLWASGDCPESGWAINTARNIYQAIPNTSCNDNDSACPIDPYYKRCWNECTGTDINCHSRPTTAAMRAAGAPEYHETCDPGYKSACGPGPMHNVTNSPPGCRLPCVKDAPPESTCASFLSHNNCPSGTTSMAVNTPCQGAGAQGKDGTEPWNCINSLHPVNIGTCWGDTAYSKDCGGNGQSAYEQIQSLPTAGTSHCELPNPSDCDPERGYSDGGKQAYELYLKLCGGGGSAACTSSACCTPNPTCSSLGSCPTYSNMPNSSLVCQGPVCDNTVGGECCKSNPNCSADVCDLNTQVFTGEGTQCVGASCTPGECCKPRARCDEGVQCNPNLYDKVNNYNSKYCEGVVCELTECCVPDPTCNAYKCPKYYSDKPNKSSIKCGQGDACVTEQCCDLNPTCASYFSGIGGQIKGLAHGGCPTHEHLNKNAAEIRCLEPNCTTGECCIFDPKCSSFKCAENNFYHTYAHVPNADNIYCNNDQCTEEQCCVATPTYALPEVETWPLYPQNYDGKSSQF